MGLGTLPAARRHLPRPAGERPLLGSGVGGVQNHFYPLQAVSRGQSVGGRELYAQAISGAREASSPPQRAPCGDPPLGPEALPRGLTKLEQPQMVAMQRLFSHGDIRRDHVLAGRTNAAFLRGPSLRQPRATPHRLSQLLCPHTPEHTQSHRLEGEQGGDSGTWGNVIYEVWMEKSMRALAGLSWARDRGSGWAP